MTLAAIAVAAVSMLLLLPYFIAYAKVSIRRSVLPTSKSPMLTLQPCRFSRQLLLSSNCGSVTDALISTIFLVESPLVLKCSDRDYLDDDHFASRLADSGYEVHILSVKMGSRAGLSFNDMYKAVIMEGLTEITAASNSSSKNIAIIANELSSAYLLNLLSELSALSVERVSIGAAILLDVVPLQPLTSLSSSSNDKQIEYLLHRFTLPIRCTQEYLDRSEKKSRHDKTSLAVATIGDSSPLWRLVQAERYVNHLRAKMPLLFEFLSRLSDDSTGAQELPKTDVALVNNPIDGKAIYNPIGYAPISADSATFADADVEREIETLVRNMKEANFDYDTSLSVAAMKKKAKLNDIHSNRVYGKYENKNELSRGDVLTARSILGPPPKNLPAIRQAMPGRVLVISSLADASPVPSSNDASAYELPSVCPEDTWGDSAAREAAALVGAAFMSVASGYETSSGHREGSGEEGSVWRAGDSHRHLKISVILKNWLRIAGA